MQDFTIKNTHDKNKEINSDKFTKSYVIDFTNMSYNVQESELTPDKIINIFNNYGTKNVEIIINDELGKFSVENKNKVRLGILDSTLHYILNKCQYDEHALPQYNDLIGWICKTVPIIKFEKTLLESFNNACKNNNIKLAKSIYSLYNHIFIFTGYTNACIEGHYEIIKWLNTLDKTNELCNRKLIVSAFMCACVRDNMDVVTCILKDKNINKEELELHDYGEEYQLFSERIKKMKF